jgi:tryptophan 7-halogenase
MHGQGIHPRGYHGLVDSYPEQKIVDYLENVRGVIANCVRAMPGHDEFIKRLCAAAERAAA